MNYAQLEKEYPTLAATPDIAFKNHVVANFLDYKDATYLVVCPDQEYYNKLVSNMGQFQTIVDRNTAHGTSFQNMYYATYKIDDSIKNEDIFRYHNDMCNIIQHASVARACYWQNNTPMPEYLSEQALCNLRIFQEKSLSAVLPMELRNSYKETIKREVTWQAKYYGAQPKRDLIKPFNHDDHQVPADFFIKHSMDATNDVVNNYFMDWLKAGPINEHPDFVYYIEKKPYEVLKDDSHKVPESSNFWTDQKELKKWRISFPKYQDKYMYNWKIRFCIRDYNKNYVPNTICLKSDSDRYISERINMEDMKNINSLCEANHIYYTVKLDDCSQEDLDHPRVTWRVEDKEMVTAILQRLMQERDNLVPMTIRDFELAEQNQPKKLDVLQR